MQTHPFLDFFKQDVVIGLIVAILIFITTIFLVVKRWIGFWLTFLFLLFAIAAGLAVSHHNLLQCWIEDYRSARLAEEEQANIQSHIAQALEEVKADLNQEKENINQILRHLEEAFNQLDEQKGRLQHFIEEAKEQWKLEETEIQPSASSE